MFSKMALPRHSEQQFRRHAKKVMCDSLGLVDFAKWASDFCSCLAQQALMLFYGETQITEGNLVINPAHQKGFWG